MLSLSMPVVGQTWLAGRRPTWSSREGWQQGRWLGAIIGPVVLILRIWRIAQLKGVRELKCLLVGFKMLIIGLVVASATVASLAIPTPASASSTGNVTVTYGSWDCARGGSPVIALMSIDRGGQVSWQSGSSATTWAPLNTSVQINATLYCQRPWWQGGSYYEYNFLAYRWFSFNGQHTYI
jgi:hypothetical protein